MAKSTERDMEIRAQAVLKSIIESGATPDEWEEKAVTALRILGKLISMQKKAAMAHNEDSNE